MIAILKQKSTKHLEFSHHFFFSVFVIQSSPAVRTTHPITNISPNRIAINPPFSVERLNCLIVTLTEKTKDSLRDTLSFYSLFCSPMRNIIFFLIIFRLNIPSHAWSFIFLSGSFSLFCIIFFLRTVLQTISASHAQPLLTQFVFRP